MLRRKDDFVSLINASKWQAGLVFAGLVYAGLAFFLPLVKTGNIYFASLIMAAPALAWPAAGAIAALAAVSAVRSWKRRKLLDQLESLGSMRWSDFERLVADGFRRLGYEVEEHGGAGPDGAVDLTLRKQGVRTLVQCKHWRSRQVGGEHVRELLGVMHAERAHGGLLVTSGAFSREAVRCASGQPIGLIGGEALLELIQEARSSAPPALAATADREAPACPTCARPMMKRQGRGRSGIVWGCTAYPVCRGTRPLE